MKLDLGTQLQNEAEYLEEAADSPMSPIVPLHSSTPTSTNQLPEMISDSLNVANGTSICPHTYCPDTPEEQDSVNAAGFGNLSVDLVTETHGSPDLHLPDPYDSDASTLPPRVPESPLPVPEPLPVEGEEIENNGAVPEDTDAVVENGQPEPERASSKFKSWL